MKKLFILFVLITNFISAQNQRFIYEYKFVSDSVNRDDVKSELMYLDISQNGSLYYSRDVFVRDSTMRAEVEKQMKAGDFNININKPQNIKGKIGYKVTKDYQNNKTYFNAKIGTDAYKVLEDRIFEWKILPEKQKIGAFEAQKATVEFAGRKWTAWFSEELPFSDGPYKFRGLPGLIVKIEDNTRSHIMELKATTKFVPAKNPENSGSISGEKKIVMIGDSFSMGKEEIEINREKYKKLFWENREDPMKSIKMMGARDGVVMKFKDQNGNDISMAEMIKKREEDTKEINKRNNNILEIDLLNR